MNPKIGSLENKTSFYYPLLLLDKEKQRGMEFLYRFCWMADEISDGPGSPVEKKRKLARFKKNLRDSFHGRPQDSFFRQFQPVISLFHLSREPLERMVRGVEQDLRPVHFRKFTELHQYALRVAGGPGLASMEIFGFKDRAHRVYAENLGVFLQIVNIVRDYREDKGLNRLYLPAEDFKRFHLNPSHVEENDSHWKPFVEFQLDRAWGFLEKARRSLSLSQRSQLMTAEAIAAVYVKLYQKLRANPRQILKGRTALSKWDKRLSVLGTAGRCWVWKAAGR
ncbi:MAG TPA: squalene/phytoene synthase family protein [bacterium]|nr:squalene/phytoene synthase family protein [bacterium]